MFIDIFRTIPADARRESLVAYQHFLASRDGTMDLEKRQLSRREEGMTRYERPLARIRDIDQQLFAKHYDAFDARAEIPQEMLLLLALVKINAAEAFGVDQSYQTVLRRALKNEDTCELVVLCEETYHTRILVSTFVNATDMNPPSTPSSAYSKNSHGLTS